MRNTEVILCTLGTRGDILPFIALGAELLRRGHSVTLLSNENWRELSDAAGLPFHAIADEDPTQSGRDDYRFFVENTLPSFARSFERVNQKALSEGRDMILVYRSNMLGMECAAEVLNVPHIKVALQPSAIRSFERPPWPLTPLATGRFQILFKSLVIPALYAMAEFSRKYRGHTNRFRRSVGIKVPWGRPSAFGTENATLVFAPPWYAMPQKDWPQNCYCVGFPFADTTRDDDTLSEFVTQHGPPIVFTPGTGVKDTAAFFDKAEAISDQLGMPAVFLGAGSERRRKAAHILASRFVDMAVLLKRARLIVHHGGIGTTAQALRAGIPQIIIPDRFDQPDNAQRIARLGLGAAVMRDTYSPEKWADIIRQLLEAPLIQQRLLKVSSDIKRTSATARAATIIERMISATGDQSPQTEIA